MTRTFRGREGLPVMLRSRWMASYLACPPKAPALCCPSHSLPSLTSAAWDRHIATSRESRKDPRRSLTVASCRRGYSVRTDYETCPDISSVSSPLSMPLSRRSYSIDKSPCSSNAASPISQRKDINRSESLRVVSNRTHRIFRPSDLIHGEVLGKGCFGQAIKVECTLYYTTYVNPCISKWPDISF